MANSTTHLDLISVSQASKEATDNALADAMSANALFGRRASTTSVLTWGYYGGPYRKADGTLLTVSNGTVALTDAATNYILETDGVVSKVTAAPSGWPAPLAAGANALYAVVCSGGAVTSYTDYRIPGLGGAISVVAADVSITDAGTYFTGTDVEAALQELGAAVAAPAAADVTIVDAGTYFTGTDVEAALQELGAAIGGAGTGDALVANPLSQFAATTSAQLAGVISDETGSGALVFATSPTLVTPVLGTPTSGNLSNCTADGTNAVGFRHIPQNSQSTAYTTVLADAGKHLLHPSADTTARTFTIDSNANVAYPIGTAITFVNQDSAGVMTIAITSDTMRLAGAGTTGSRTLAANGIATALKITSTEWVISGTGLT